VTVALVSARSDTNTSRHRLNTIIESDRVLVLDKGQIAEFDTTQNLLQNKASLFYALAAEAEIIE
jgi:ATP-binding cassette, subfamily C (CFTR/MRP), member 1